MGVDRPRARSPRPPESAARWAARINAGLSVAKVDRAPPADGIDQEHRARRFDRVDGQDFLLDLAGVDQVRAEDPRLQTRGERWGEPTTVDLEHYIGVTGLGKLATLVPEQDILSLGMGGERAIEYSAPRRLVA